MKVLFMLFTSLVPIVCALSAIYLAALEIDGWGWFLLVAFLTADLKIELKA